MTTEFIYNGAGVAIGDLNNDGLQDLFFAGNQVDNKLYLNQGNLKFKDVSELAKISKPDPYFWSSGVNILDINLDGQQDIYICNTLRSDPRFRENFLYINQGNSSEGVPTFVEMAAAYGLADTSHSSHAQFFDYDNDGDLDLFVGVNLIEEKYPNAFIKLTNDGTAPNRDNLFQNNWNDSLSHPVFEDVSIKARLLQDGYSHSTLIFDINEDGWQDIYVANDYESNDLIFINNQDGTFTDQADKIFKHFSLSSMGSDVADINNDGRLDLFTSEMQPYYNKRKKLFQGPSNYRREILTKQYGYTFQYMRNTLQLNKGANPETGIPTFAEIGLMAGVQETDWSWATLFADYDNDGWQDLYVVNGFPKDVTDRDFSDFRANASSLVDQKTILAAIPEVKSPNFLFKNLGQLQFENVTESWGLSYPTFSNGAAYGDLDNDGDLDLVVNNINDPVYLFENQSVQQFLDSKYLRINLKGSKQNPDAFGTAVEIFRTDSTQQVRQKSNLLSGRGYLSKSENTLHFGLGDSDFVDSIKIYWPGGLQQTIGRTPSNQTIDIAFAKNNTAPLKINQAPQSHYFTEVSKNYGLDFQHREIDFADYNFQRTLPHKFSQYGPALSVGDINGDQLDDLLVSASRSFNESWFIQKADGSFEQKEATYKTNEKAHEEDAGTLLFDADGDEDLDLYIARGSAQYRIGDELYQDVLLLNDGNGNFTMAENALPVLTANGSAVKAADYDRDGDLDLFVGSRVLPRSYPKADRSYLLRNDSQNGNVKFVDVTRENNPTLEFPGLISDALWTDFNGDNWPDLVLAGEWMPIKFFENQQGQLVDVTSSSGIDNHKGWWTSLAAADLDNDGDMDYVAGNFGENTYFQCSADQPIKIYGKDLDNNGSIDPLISCYWSDSLGTKREYIYHPLQDVIKQFTGIRKKYNSFAEFGETTVSEMFDEEEMKDAIILTTNWMKNAWIENLGNGQFQMHQLPLEAQVAPVYGILPTDVNADNYLDLLLVGNDFGIEVQQGRGDALNGLVLLNKEGNEFEAMPFEETRFFVPGDGKSLVQIALADQSVIYLASQNNDVLKAFELQSDRNIIRLSPNEVKAQITMQDGTTRLHEFYWGNTFQSQSSRILIQPDNFKEILFYDGKNQITRTVN